MLAEDKAASQGQGQIRLSLRLNKRLAVEPNLKKRNPITIRKAITGGVDSVSK